MNNLGFHRRRDCCFDCCFFHVAVDGETILDASATSFTASAIVSDEIDGRTTSASTGDEIVVVTVVVFVAGVVDRDTIFVAFAASFTASVAVSDEIMFDRPRLMPWIRPWFQ